MEKNNSIIKELQSIEEKVYDGSILLLTSLEKLGKLASDIYGQNLIADICNGHEIEFRINGDPDSCIRMEEIIEKLEKHEN